MINQTPFAHFVSFDPATDYFNFTVCANSNTSIELPIDEDPFSTCDEYDLQLTVGEGKRAATTETVSLNSIKGMVINVYPIPVADVLNFAFKNVDVKTYPVSTISIITNYGQVVKQLTIKDYSNVQVNVNDLAQGTYFYKLISGNTVLQQNAFVKL